MLVFDGRHLLYRTSDAFKELSAEVDGYEVGTGGMYGFLSCAIRVFNRYGGRVYVAWEGRRSENFRMKLYPDYKRRDEVHADKLAFLDDMQEQELRLKRLLCLLGVRQYAAVGAEADDVIATLATRAASKGMKTLVYTGDSDLRQLVSPLVAVVSPMTGPNRREDTLYDDDAKVRGKHGVLPLQIPDLKALAGDTSDNIPGVDGIGPVSAVKLLTAYNTVNGVIKAAMEDHAAWPIAERFKEAIRLEQANVRLYKQLATVRSDVDMTVIKPVGDKARFVKEVMAYKMRTLVAPAELQTLYRMAL